VKDRSRLALVAAATAVALVWFLPNLSFVVAQDSGSTVETSTTSSSSSTSTSTTSSTSTTLPVTVPPITSILLQLGAAVAAPGDPVGGSGQGAPFSTIGLTFNSTPVPLGNVTADVNGNFLFVFNVPLSAEPGLHTVVARGPNGAQGSANITVTAPIGAPLGYPPIIPPAAATPAVPVVQTAPTPSGPAFTGANVSGLIVLAGAALALGGMAFTFGRLEPAIALPRRRRLQWAHRRRHSGMAMPHLEPMDLVQIAAGVALAIALGLSLARL
jgi:hypothetical protein